MMFSTTFSLFLAERLMKSVDSLRGAVGALFESAQRINHVTARHPILGVILERGLGRAGLAGKLAGKPKDGRITETRFSGGNFSGWRNHLAWALGHNPCFLCIAVLLVRRPLNPGAVASFRQGRLHCRQPSARECDRECGFRKCEHGDAEERRRVKFGNERGRKRRTIASIVSSLGSPC